MLLFFILILKIFILLPVLNKVKSRFSTLILTITLLNNIIIYGDFKTVLKLALIIYNYFIIQINYKNTANIFKKIKIKMPLLKN